MEIDVNRILTLATGAALLAAGLVSVDPSQATAVPAAVSLPCLPGVPLAGDFDGDGKAERMVGVVGYDGHPVDRYQVTPGNGGPPTWLYLDGGISGADLNGDVCADAVSAGLREAKLLLGGPGGLDPATTSSLALPQTADVRPGGSDRLFISSAVGIRHDGISQVIVAAYLDDEGPRGSPFLDVFTLDAAGAAGTPQAIILSQVTNTEGAVLAASEASVAVGLPSLTVSGKTDAGGVMMFTVDPTDHVTLVRRATITQNSPGVPGKAEAGDCFGYALSMRDGRLAVGVPLEDTGRTEDAGAVQPILWKESNATYKAFRRITKNTRGVSGISWPKDWFGYNVLITRGLTGAGSYDIAIGARESAGKAGDTGSVTVANFAKARFRTLTQNSPGVPGRAEQYDQFGAGLGVLRAAGAADTLLIGAPGEQPGRGREIGYVVRSDGRRLSASTSWKSIPPPSPVDTTFERWGQEFCR